MDCHGSSLQMPGISEKRLREGKKKGRNARIFTDGRLTEETENIKNTLLKMQIRLPKQMRRTEWTPSKRFSSAFLYSRMPSQPAHPLFLIIMVRFEIEPSFFIYIISIGSCFSKECLNIMFIFIPPSVGFIINEQVFDFNLFVSFSSEKAASNQLSEGQTN